MKPTAPLPPATRVAVLDDDPTGMQTVQGCLALTRWDERALGEAFTDACPYLFVLTNTRALTQSAARHRIAGVVDAVLAAARASRQRVIFVSRSDSTLRSHFPTEVHEIARGLARAGLPEVDACFVAPVFVEGGRITRGDTHYLRVGDRWIATSETEFARDAVFGYRTSHLPAYIEERSGGTIRAEAVRSVTLQMLREWKADALAAWLRALERHAWVIVNAESYADLDRFSAAVREALTRGKCFVFQSAASLVKSLVGAPDAPLLADRLSRSGEPGLVIVGSHVQQTTRQLERALAVPGTRGIELPVGEHSAASTPEAACATRDAEAALRDGLTPILYTARDVRRCATAADQLALGRGVSDMLVGIVRALETAPAFVIAKGGITAHEILAEGLGVPQVRVLGQALKGVPVVMLPASHRFGAIPYVIFPGNVGQPDDLARLIALNLGRHV